MMDHHKHAWASGSHKHKDSGGTQYARSMIQDASRVLPEAYIHSNSMDRILLLLTNIIYIILIVKKVKSHLLQHSFCVKLKCLCICPLFLRP